MQEVRAELIDKDKRAMKMIELTMEQKIKLIKKIVAAVYEAWNKIKEFFKTVFRVLAGKLSLVKEHQLKAIERLMQIKQMRSTWDIPLDTRKASKFEFEYNKPRHTVRRVIR